MGQKGLSNPFRIGERVRGGNFCNREAEIASVRTAMRSPAALLVYGPRRMGKSSLIDVAAEAARLTKPRPIIVVADISTATSLFDVASRLLRSLYLETRSLRIRIEDLLGGLAPKVTIRLDDQGGPPSFTFGIERRTASDEERRRAFEAVFERLLVIRERTKRPLAVVLDEFQALGAIGGERGEWHLRDLMQRRGDLSYICAGSQESLIQAMIGPERAFHKMFEMLHLGPLDEAQFADWIDKRLRTGLKVAAGVGREVVRLAGPRTQDVVQVARQLYFLGLQRGLSVGVQDVTTALDEVVRNEAPLIRALFGSLSAHQQDLLRVIALGAEQLFSAEVRDLYGLPGASSVHKAVEALVARGLIVRDGNRAKFDSPFVKRWVAREVASDLG